MYQVVYQQNISKTFVVEIFKNGIDVRRLYMVMQI